MVVVGGGEGIRELREGSGALVSEDYVVDRVIVGEVGQKTVVGCVLGDVVERELLDKVSDRTREKRFPCAHFNATCAEE